MSIENIYSYIEYLNFAVEQLEEAVNQRVEENARLQQALTESDALIGSMTDALDRAEARAQLAEAQANKVQDHITAQAKQIVAMQVQIQDSNKALAENVTGKQKKVAPQDDLFGTWTAGSPQPKARVANDQNALLLAQKLDSTIDKVQRMIAAQAK